MKKCYESKKSIIREMTKYSLREKIEYHYLLDYVTANIENDKKISELKKEGLENAIERVEFSNTLKEKNKKIFEIERLQN